jgi:hypothetical protein
MRTRAPTRPLAIVALLWLAQACSGGQTGDESSPDEPTKDAGTGDGNLLDQIVRQSGSGNYQPVMSWRELVMKSERIATGTIVAIRPGPSVDESPDDAEHSNVALTAVMELAVAQVLKGDPSDALYVDFRVGSAEEGFSGPPPSERVLLFLVQADFGNGVLLNSGAGVPPGQKLYVLTTPQALFVETPSGIQEAFDANDSWLTTDSSFGAQVQAVEALVRGK